MLCGATDREKEKDGMRRQKARRLRKKEKKDARSLKEGQETAVVVHIRHTRDCLMNPA